MIALVSQEVVLDLFQSQINHRRSGLGMRHGNAVSLGKAPDFGIGIGCGANALDNWSKSVRMVRMHVV